MRGRRNESSPSPAHHLLLLSTKFFVSIGSRKTAFLLKKYLPILIFRILWRSLNPIFFLFHLIISLKIKILIDYGNWINYFILFFHHHRHKKSILIIHSIKFSFWKLDFLQFNRLIYKNWSFCMGKKNLPWIPVEETYQTLERVRIFFKNFSFQ